MDEALDFPLPPTTGPNLAESPTSPGPYLAEPPTPLSAAEPAPAPALPEATKPVPPPPLPEVDELTALREKVAELDQVISLAKTRVETLGAEKREALERALQLEVQLEAAQRREAELLERVTSHESPQTLDEKTLAELLNRVAALEATMAPSRAAA